MDKYLRKKPKKIEQRTANIYPTSHQKHSKKAMKFQNSSSLF